MGRDSARPFDVHSRAVQSAGASADPIYRMVRTALRARRTGGTLLDVGCGTGNLLPHVADLVDDYVGVDVVRYDAFPTDRDFHAVDLETGAIPLPDEGADTVVAVETIEHLENPRAFVRELARLVKPGGWIFITTPNQRSMLSLLALVLKGHFVAFQDTNYPAHLTALLETDLRRIAAECRLAEVAVDYTKRGRMPLTARHFPTFLSRLAPRLFSDNLLLSARKPAVGDRAG